MSPVAIDFGRLCDELRTLTDAPAARDEASRARVEWTLTDGYAHAMSLELDRLRLERQIGEVAAQVDVRARGAKTEELQELSARLADTSRELEHLRELLAAVRRRPSPVG
jgi:ABC-type phosphate transport system auxiliary subunit